MTKITKIYIFDIDNTLCNTWPTLQTVRGPSIFRFFREAWRISFIPCFSKMMNCARTRFKRRYSEVYFLSARHWSLWPFTYVYLARHIGFFSPHRLSLVPSASEKMNRFERFLKKAHGLLIVIDDLSYNSEFGKTLFFSEVVEYLNSKPGLIRYINKHKIDLINDIKC